MKPYWYTRNKVLFIGGIGAILFSIVVFSAGNSKGFFCSTLVGFEARLFAFMEFILGLGLMASIFFNTKDRDLSWLGVIVIVAIHPFLQLLSREIAHFLGK
jgi:hypothetical protein